MGATFTVRSGSKLTVAKPASATTITVLDAGVNGLDYQTADSVRIFGLNSTPTPTIINLVDADSDATAVANVISGLDANALAAAAIGSVVANLATDEDLTENVDYVVDYTNGQLRFINPALVAGSTFAAQFQYRRAAHTRVRLGKTLPILEFSLFLEHVFPDGRKLQIVVPRAAVTPDNPSLKFDDSDWIGTDMVIDVLASTDPADVDSPFGYIVIEHDATSGQELLGYNPDTYSVGSFTLKLTPLNATTAAQHGLGSGAIDVGNVKVGSVDATQNFLKHYYGVPKKKDKTVLLQKELTITATVENLNTSNLALLFDGERAEDPSTATYGDDMVLLTVPDDIATPEGQTRWIPLRKVLINPG